MRRQSVVTETTSQKPSVRQETNSRSLKSWSKRGRERSSGRGVWGTNLVEIWVWAGCERVVQEGRGGGWLTVEGEGEAEDVHHDLPGVELGVLGVELVQWLAHCV